jgi:glycosyltransferase involved in cell wall biosynthesis
MMKKLLIIQYAGDFKEAYQNRESGKGGNYYAQAYSLDIVCQQAALFDEVATLCCVSDTPHNELLFGNIRSISVSGKNGFNLPEVLRLVGEYNPTDLILRTPHVPLLKYAVKKNINVFLTLADSFQNTGLRATFSNYQLRRLLNHTNVKWVANHGWTASSGLLKLGINSAKVLPWDWPHSINPSQFPAKILVTKMVYQLIFVGHISRAKGLGDAIEAVAHLKAAGVKAILSVYGKGKIDEFNKLASSLGVEDQIEFKGLVANSEIIPKMAAADFVLIPSRHEYAEGFPMTIYEALCSRTVIVASDHPMFGRFLVHNKNAMIFAEGISLDLSERILDCVNNPPIYTRLSESAVETWAEIQVPFLWGDLVKNWCSLSYDEFREWVDGVDNESRFRSKISNFCKNASL